MRLIERRIGLLFAAFLLLFAAIIGRAVYLNVAKAEKLKRLAAGQQVSQPKIPARRGQIFDRKGHQLAATEDATTVFATPYLVRNPARAAQRIAPVLDTTPEDLTAKLTNRKSGFVYLARQIDPRRADRVRKMKIEGIDLVDEPRRRYPQEGLAGQVLGSVGVDGKGLFGIEYVLDDKLRGRAGRQRVVKGAGGEPISLVETRRMQPGKDVRLSIDSVIQERTETVLADTARAQQAKDAAAIVMNPQTGEILAMASWPAIDPNHPRGLKSTATANLPIGFSYEPGSTFKAVTVSAALEEHVVTPSTTFSVGPSIQVYDRVIENAHGEGGCTCTVAQILARSVNTGTIRIGQEVGPIGFDRYVRKFGFGRKTGIEDVPGEEQGIILSPSEYSGPTLATMSIGQGLSVTSLQIARAYSAIANGGILLRPRLVEQVGAHREARPRGKRIIGSKTASQLRQMLEGVLAPGGTAQEAKIPGYEIAGKTGTAEKVINGAYSKSAFVASFVGFAPVDDPKLLTLVVVDQPLGQFGGVVAAPAFEKIMSFALPYLGVSPR